MEMVENDPKINLPSFLDLVVEVEEEEDVVPVVVVVVVVPQTDLWTLWSTRMLWLNGLLRQVFDLKLTHILLCIYFFFIIKYFF